jgi:two-component system, OmpR family, sensor histidine kinase SenX3
VFDVTLPAVVAASFPALVAEGLLTGALGVGVGVWIASTRARAGRRARDEELVRLRRSADRAAVELRERDEDLAAIGGASRAVPFGLLVVDANGRELVRNDAVDAVLGPNSLAGDQRPDVRTDGEVMAGGTLRRLVERAADGQRGREALDIVGPPRRSYVITAEPILGAVDGRSAVVGTVQDVSEQRRTEAMRQDFISNVSHELRTPVGAVAILAETLASETDRSAMVRLSGRLEREAHRLSAMIDDLLALGNVESSSSAGDDLVAVPEIIDEAIERARASADTRRILVDVLDVGQGLNVWGDRRQLVTALHNLIENALKYSDKGAPILVTATIDSSSPNRVAIAVADRGIGIPHRDQERVFERFYRVDRARARDTGGSGLGLAIVRHVVRNHNGEITIHSVEGEGSTFTLLLPGVSRNAASVLVSATDGPPLTPERA